MDVQRLGIISKIGKAMISGFSMIMIESTAVCNRGKITHKDLCLSNKKQLKEFKQLVSYLKHLNDIPICIQLSHAGRKGSSQIPWIKSNQPLKKDKWITLSPSDLPKDSHWPKPKKMNLKDIVLLKKEFINSTKLSLKAGFDGIELHIAHGYLLHQFFSPISNKRKDIYGGCLKNRCRIILEIAEKVIKICRAKGIIVGARITGKDWLKGGSDINDAIFLVKSLKKIGLDYVCVSSGGIKTKTNLNEKKKFNINLAKKIKAKCKIITRVAGNIKNIKEAKNILKTNKADAVAFGRVYLKNPNFIINSSETKNENKIIPKPYLRAFF